MSSGIAKRTIGGKSRCAERDRQTEARAIERDRQTEREEARAMLSGIAEPNQQ